MNRTPLRAARAVTGEKSVLRPALCIATLLSVALAFSVTAACAQTFTALANVSNDRAGDFPQVIVDSAGNVDIAYVDFVSGEPKNGVWFVRGTFSGGTFHPNSSAVRVSQSAGGSFRMALESSCVIDIAYMDQQLEFSLQGDIFFAQSTDCGATFTAINITNSALSYRAHSAPELVLNNGHAEVMWWASTDPASTRSTLFHAQRSSATSFTTPAVVATSANELQCLEGVAAPGGNTDMVWCDGSIEFLNSANGGQPKTIGVGTGAQFALDTAGNVNVIWTDTSSGSSAIEFSRSTGQTGGFSAPKGLSSGYSPRIGVDGNGDLDLVWWAGRGAVLFSRSTDGGNNFSGPVTVAASIGGLGSPATVQMAVDSSGGVDLTWEYPQAPEGILFSRSDRQGGSFSVPVHVTDNVGAPFSVGTTTDSSNHVLVAWTNHDVFISEGDAPKPASDFTISAAPASLAALPGGSATAQVTLTARGGFDQAVNLSCGKLPQGAECSFDPASVTPGNSGTLVTLMLTIPPTLPPGGFPFTIEAASTTISQFQDMQITVGVLMGSVTPAAATIPIDVAANFAITVTSTGGFGRIFNLSCNAPAGVACTFSPSSAFLPIDGRVTSVLTVTILSLPATAGAPGIPASIFPLGLPMARTVLPISGLMFLLLGAPAFAFLRRREDGRFALARTMASIVLTMGLTMGLTVALAAAMLSCGGATTKSTVGVGGTPVGTGGTSGIPGTGGTGGMGGTGGSAGAGGATSGGVTTSGSTSVTFPLTVLAQAGASVVNVGTVSVTVP